MKTLTEKRKISFGNIDKYSIDNIREVPFIEMQTTIMRDISSVLVQQIAISLQRDRNKCLFGKRYIKESVRELEAHVKTLEDFTL